MKDIAFATNLLFVLGAVGCGKSALSDISNDAALDARPSDGARDADISFSQWWDPACGAPQATCEHPDCRPTELVQYTSACATAVSLSTGCVSNKAELVEWHCWVRVSDGTILESQDYPLSQDGLQSCQQAGLQQGEGFYEPPCGDAGSTDARFDGLSSFADGSGQ